MFIKNWVSYFWGKEIDKGFWKDFKAIVDCYAIQDEERKLKLENASLSFLEDDSDSFVYKISLIGRDDNSDVFKLPINKDTVACFSTIPENQTVSYEIKIDKVLTVEFVFKIINGNYDKAGQFRKILSFLIYQSTHKKSVADCPDKEDIYDLVRPKDSEPSNKKLLSLYSRLKDDPRYRFVNIGRFCANDLQSNTNNNQVILPVGIFAIINEGNFFYQIKVFNQEGEICGVKTVDEDFNYYLDAGLNTITWMENQGHQLVCLNFGFEKNVIGMLRVLISTLIIETKNKMTMKEIVDKEKNNWDQYYKENDSFVEDEDRDIINKYGDEDVYMEMDYEEKPSKEPEFESEILSFTQSKSNQQAYVNRGDMVNVYGYNDKEGQYCFKSNLPTIKHKGNQIYPIKLLIQDMDSKLVFSDKKQRDSLFYYDLNKTKIVNEFKPKANKNIKDIALIGGKQAAFNENPYLISVSSQSINKLDPRIAKPVVHKKEYKTKVDFTKVLSTNNDNFLVGSTNGDVRLFNSVGSNAKNLIPSLFGDAIKFIDSSKDGKYVLLTFKRYLVLLPTFQKGYSAFNTTFKNNSRPRPIVLRVNPAKLLKNGLKDPVFTSARFDEKKDQLEKYIMATCGNLFITWNLAKILKGNINPDAIDGVDDILVNGEFVYNQNDLVMKKEKAALLLA